MPEITPNITASEIGDYVYCKRGWWLRSNEKLADTEAMLQGNSKHSALLKDLVQHDRVKILFQIILLVAMLGVAVYLLLLLLRS